MIAMFVTLRAAIGQLATLAALGGTVIECSQGSRRGDRLLDRSPCGRCATIIYARTSAFALLHIRKEQNKRHKPEDEVQTQCIVEEETPSTSASWPSCPLL
jgi:hypothetical protein